MGKPTDKMIRFAHKICWGLGMDTVPTEVDSDFDSCARFIKENKGEFYNRNHEHDKWLRGMERKAARNPLTLAMGSRAADQSTMS